MTSGVGIRRHWDDVYRTRAATERGWYEAEPATSRRLVERVAGARSDPIVDVGAGASSLVDHLLVAGYRDVTLLDIAEAALEETRARLGVSTDHVTFVVADVLRWRPPRRYHVWHDRAVFHFLTDPSDRTRYVEVASRAVEDGGHLIVGTFSPDAPTHCSGLEVTRYSADDLAAAFAPALELVHAEEQVHTTPGGTVQPYTWVVLRKRSS